MAGIDVTGIYRKFQILIAYNRVSGWKAIADHFGVAVGTVKGWGQGNAAQPRDTLPSRHLDRLLDLIAATLPDRTSPDRIQEITFGPASLLEQALRAASPAALEQLLVEEADRENVRLVRKPAHSGLIELETSAPDHPVLSVALGDFFRIECDAPFPVRHVIAVQHAHRLWGFVPAEVSPDLRRILLPGMREDGTPAFMCERTQAGPHRFIVFQTSAAMPIAAELSDRADIVLDYATLSGLVSVYRGQPETKRRLYLLDLLIEADDGDA